MSGSSTRQNDAERPPDQDVEAETRQRMAEMLRRTGEQTEKLTGGAGLPGTEAEARRNAQEPHDWPEVWGPRVGRALGYAFALYLLWHLLGTYVLE